MFNRFKTFEPQPEVKLCLDESVSLTDKAKLSLYKKSQNSGISVDILEEVYHRGYRIWNESFGGTPEQFAFDRVNSFVSEGFAMELDSDLLEKRGLWDNIWAKRKRIAAGSGERMRKPGDKGAPTAAAIKASQNEDYKTPESAELQTNDGNKPNGRFDGTDAGANHYARVTPGQGDRSLPHHQKKKLLDTVKEVVREQLEESWQDKKYKNPSGGLTKAGVNAYRREHPGSKLKTAVTTEPSKLKPGSKAANRRKSFCARMGGMKKRLTSAKTARDPDSRINKALRKWHCEDNQNEMTAPLGTTGKRSEWNPPMVPIRMADGKIKKLPPGKSGSSGGGGKE